MENSTPSDSDLLAVWLASRSEPAFRALVSRYAALVHMAARRTCGDEALAADASQLVFILLAQKAPTLTSRTSLAGWLHIAAVMYAKRLIAKSRRETRKLHHLHTVIDPQFPSSNDGTWREIQPLLDGALSSLSEKDRETLLLKFYRSLSVREIATTLGIGTDAAQKRLDRATERLRQKLTRRGVHATGSVFAAVLVAGFANDAHAASYTISLISTKAVAASAITTQLSTRFIYHLMTHQTKLTTAAAIVLVGTAITAAVIISGSNESSAFASPSRSPRLSEGEMNGSQVSTDMDTEIQTISCPRPPISPEITALNERFGKARVQLAQRYTEDMAATLKSKIKILDDQLGIFDPENINEGQLAKLLATESAGTLQISHAQTTTVKERYSANLRQRLDNLTKTFENITTKSAEITEMLLCKDAKTHGKLSEPDYAKKHETLKPSINSLIQLCVCDEFYVSPSILEQHTMVGILTDVLNPQQSETFRLKPKCSPTDPTILTQPADTASFHLDFNDESKLEDIGKKMGDARQEMAWIAQRSKRTIR